VVFLGLCFRHVRVNATRQNHKSKNFQILTREFEEYVYQNRVVDVVKVVKVELSVVVLYVPEVLEVGWGDR